MSVVWRKVWRDLWLNKLRTILVVLSTAAGVFALGLIFGMSGVMRTRFTESHQASVAPHIVFFTSRFRQDVVDATLREPGVVDAEGEGRTAFRWKLPGDQDWRDGTLIAREDYDAQHMYLVDLLQGEWPAERTLAVERMSSEYYDLPLGATIVSEVGRRERSVSIDGIARHPWTPPPQLGMGDATFCTTPETAAWLTGEEEVGFNMLKVRLESFSDDGANAVAERIENRLTRIGMEVWGYEVIDPDVHWAQDMMDAIMLILGVLGVLALGLGGFLIINMMNANIAQQVWQIGVMKVVGATGWRVARVYLAMASVYGLLALFIAVPLGAIAAHLLAGWLLDLFNIPVGELSLTPAAVIIQFSVGLIVPLLAALVPVIGAARITAHQAISSYGLAAGFGGNWLDRLIVGLHQLPRPLALSLRNTFRRKARIALTLLTLVLGGVMFLVVLSLSASMSNTLNLLLDDFGFDVYASLDRAYRVNRIVDVAMSVPGVTIAEVWNHRGAEVALSGGEERSIFLQGVPHDSAIYSPRIIAGRGFLPKDDRAILLNNKIATDGGFGVGDEVALTIEGRESLWTVVGLIINVNNDQRDSIVPFDALARETGSVHRGSSVWIRAEEHDAAAQEALIDDLRDTYAKNRVEVAHFESAEAVRRMNQSQFDIITYLMLVMSVLAAIVGSIGLMSTMSINVVERGREIGVMRAIGATSAIIAVIFVAEGLLIGLLSWLLALPLSYPGARAFSSLVGGTLFELPLDFRYPVNGILLWLGIVAVLSTVASLWPALKATKVSVRVALAYE